jgi:hypothetical protein
VTLVSTLVNAALRPLRSSGKETRANPLRDALTLGALLWWQRYGDDPDLPSPASAAFVPARAMIKVQRRVAITLPLVNASEWSGEAEATAPHKFLASAVDSAS